MIRTVSLAGLLAFAAVALGGCAAFSDVRSDVSSFSTWPAGRQPASYVFERLPSQQAQPEQQQRLEDAARAAVQAAGFTPAADAQAADVSIQLGARVNANERSIYDDPFWWRGGGFFAYGRGRGGIGAWGPGLRFDAPSYEREVAVLIRDRKTGQALFEARASNDGASPSIGHLLGAMYAAALQDFPNAGANPHKVVTRIAP